MGSKAVKLEVVGLETVAAVPSEAAEVARRLGLQVARRVEQRKVDTDCKEKKPQVAGAEHKLVVEVAAPECEPGLAGQHIAAAGATSGRSRSCHRGRPGQPWVGLPPPSVPQARPGSK